MRKTFLLLSFLFVFYSCADPKPLVFNSEILKLQLPVGWYVKKANKFNDTDRYFIFQSGKVIADGVITISIFEGTYDLDEMIEKHKKKTAHQEIVGVDTRSTYDATEETLLGKYESLHSKYTTKVLGVKSKGVVYALHENGKTIFVVIQGLPKKDEVFENAFKELHNSLVLL